MENAKISLYQLYSLMVLYGLGSSTVLGIGSQAKQDAWITIIIGMISGMILLTLYSIIYKKYPDLSLVEILEKLLGKFFGKLVAFIYLLYFLFFSILILRDIADLITLFILTETPNAVLTVIAVVVVYYGVYLGIETIARFGFIIFVITTPLKLLFPIGAFVSGITKLENLLPILENGWKPIIDTVFPLLITTPFGQMFVFLTLIPYVNNKKGVIKTGILAMLTVGFILLIITIGNIITLGPFMIDILLFPTIQTVRMINIFEIIQRIEGLAIFTFLSCSFIKVTILAYSVAIGLKILFNNKKYQTYILPLAIISIIGTLVYTNSLNIHLEARLKYVPRYLNTPLEIIFPIILIIFIGINKIFKTENK